MNKEIKKNWYVYMIRCEDQSLYTGITTDVERRFEEHKSGRGAKYTKIKKPKNICIIFQTENRSSASRLEYFIKKLTKKQKEDLLFSEKNKIFFIKKVKKELNIEIM